MDGSAVTPEAPDSNQNSFAAVLQVDLELLVPLLLLFLLQVFRIFKLARVMKLARHSPGLQAIAYTLQV